MKQAVWGYAVLVLGVLAIMITWFFTQVTNTDQHNYNLLKETVESAMYDAIDLSAYRNDGSIEINEVKFMESFVRRFAENADLSNTYDIYIYDISTKPPKVSLSVNSCKQTNGTNCNKSADNLTFTISNRVDAILETEWTKQEPQDVKITFKIPGSEDKTSIVKEGETIILPSMPTWCNDETVTFKDSAGHIYTNNDIAIKDVTLEFQCSNVKSYSISYNLDGGTNYDGAPTSYTYGVGATINGTPTKTGYAFGGWCTDSAKANCSTSQTISKTTTESKTLYAKWTAKSYNITYKLDGGTNYSGAPTSYTYGVGAKINGTPKKDNYTFKGWCTNSKLENCSTSQTISTTATDAKSFYAKWEANTIYCSAGTYYNGTSCVTCTTNHACSGGTFNKNGTAAGIVECKEAEGKTAPSGASSCSNICTYIDPNTSGGAIGTVAQAYGVNYATWTNNKIVLACTCTYGSCKAADYKNCYIFKGNTCKGDNGCGYIGYGSHFQAMCYAVKY